jgi:hypothetical protein
MSIVIAPVAVAKVPCIQDIHVAMEIAPDAVEYVPARHDVHAVTDARLLAVEYVPGTHALQIVAAVTSEKNPGGQYTQLLMDDAFTPVE